MSTNQIVHQYMFNISICNQRHTEDNICQIKDDFKLCMKSNLCLMIIFGFTKLYLFKNINIVIEI